MTYTAVGYDRATGELGVAIATYSLAAGGLCPAIVSNAGALTVQANLNPEMRTLGASLLTAGASAGHTNASLVAADAHAEYRQFGVVDVYGRAAAHTGTKNRAWAGQRCGDGYVMLGNVLAGERVVAAMETAYVAAVDTPLADRLLRALEAGRDAGGQVGGSGHVTERSASLLLHGRTPVADLDLRVDLHDDAVTEMRRLYNEFKEYLPFHHQRHIDPANTPPQEQFVAGLRRTGRRGSTG